MKETRNAYEEKIDAQLNELRAQIALVKAKTEKAEIEAAIEYYRAIEAVQ